MKYKQQDILAFLEERLFCQTHCQGDQELWMVGITLFHVTGDLNLFLVESFSGRRESKSISSLVQFSYICQNKTEMKVYQYLSKGLLCVRFCSRLLGCVCDYKWVRLLCLWIYIQTKIFGQRKKETTMPTFEKLAQLKTMGVLIHTMKNKIDKQSLERFKQRNLTKNFCTYFVLAIFRDLQSGPTCGSGYRNMCYNMSLSLMIERESIRIQLDIPFSSEMLVEFCKGFWKHLIVGCAHKVC